MAIGNQYTRGTLNQRAGNLATAARDIARSIAEFYGDLNELGHDGLMTVDGGGFTDGEAADMLAAFADLNGWTQIYHGQPPTTGYGADGLPYDFDTIAGKLHIGA